jgi:hypothetical protein
MADERKKGEKGGEREDVPRGERAGGEALCTVGREVAEEEEMPPSERYERANERVSRKQQRKKRQEI